MSITIATRKRKLRTRCLLLRKQSLKERDAIGMDILGRGCPFGIIRDLKKVIKGEMDKESLRSFITAKNQAQSQMSDHSINTVTHSRVECDSCGVAPIVGTRYKCSVCKNFDFC